jgi:hypothetical protein
LPNGYFRRPTWKHSLPEKFAPFSASQEAVRELRLTFFCDEAALNDEEREAFQLLRHLAQDGFIEWHDWHAHPPKWTPNAEGDCYTFESYDDRGRVQTTARSDWIRKPMSDSELLFMAHERIGQDVLVTTNASLLELSRSTDNANILPPSLALPLTHLYLRTRGQFISEVGDRYQGRLNRGFFYDALLQSLLPRLSAFTGAATRQHNACGALSRGIRSRCIRGLQGQDDLGRFFFGQRSSWDDLDRMCYHFEYVTLLLVGAIDAQARILNYVYDVGFAPHEVRYSKRFQKELRAVGGGAICNLVESGPHFDFWEGLRAIRNRIHGEPLGEIGYTSPASGDMNLLTLEGKDGATVLEKSRQLGDPTSMGIFPFERGILIEPFRCASFLVRHALEFIGAVADATTFAAPKDSAHPLPKELFTDRTLHNMKLFCKSVAVL